MLVFLRDWCVQFKQSRVSHALMLVFLVGGTFQGLLAQSATNAIRVNAGGSALVDSQGNSWASDYGFSGGAPWRGSKLLPNYPDGEIYETARTSSKIFSYKFTVPNGNYRIRLRFAEVGTAKPGERLFNVYFNGVRVLERLDIVSRTGAIGIPYDFVASTSINTKIFAIVFEPLAASAVISGIEILPDAGPAASPAPPQTFQLSPSSANLNVGGTVQFSALFGGVNSPTNVNWSLNPQVGSITSDGRYTAPSSLSAAQTVTVTGVSKADASIIQSAVVSLTPVNVTISGGPASVKAGTSGQFSASVTGASNTGVNWSISPAVGSISSTGLYTAPATTTSNQTITVKATSQADLSRSASINVTVVPPGSLSISPNSGTLGTSQSLQFTASSVALASSAVTWSISPVVGSISTSGLYTAPSSISSAQTVTVTATSQADATVRATASISLVPTVQVSLTPTSVTLGEAAQQQFQATVTNSSNQAVNWTLSPSIGTITSAGLYTAPATINPNTTVTLTATSAADPSKTASAVITLTSAVRITLTPSSVSLGATAKQLFTATVTGAPNTSVNWTISPAVGTIGTDGTYTAPTTILNTQTVTVTATSQANNTRQATATVNLTPSVTVSSSPASAILGPGGTQQFSASVGGSTQTGVNWSISPVVGTISSSGLYTAPATLSAEQTVTVKATSQADGTKSANSTVTLRPPVTISMTPGQATLLASATVQFAATVTGTTNTSVSWTLSPAVGSISATGLYTAPSSITAAQLVTVTAISAADTNQKASAQIQLQPNPTITLTPSVLSLSAGGSQQFTAQVSGLTNSSLTWTLTPNVGSISAAGLYSAPATITSGQTITVRAQSVANANVFATASVNLNVSPSLQKTMLPIEVMGRNGTTVSVAMQIPSVPSGALEFRVKTHGVAYATQASVRVNGGAWIALDDTKLPAGSLDLLYGGVGGGYSVLRFAIPLAAGAIIPGSNTFDFRFNQTDGVSSGFRVLSFNVHAASAPLIAESNFAQDDPSQWRAPSSNSTDIQAGKLLYQTGSLTVPTATGAAPIQAKCSNCHTIDGRDLKYFNYSNFAIQSRAVFHGLTSAQGDQIASYIRNLAMENPGRPWDPPYQPGVGVDQAPISKWSAGAGIQAVLESDAEMLPYVAPTVTPADFSPTGDLSLRSTPVAFQLLDWNRWLPRVHPIDAYGSAFNTSKLNNTYLYLRSALAPGDATKYARAKGGFDTWDVDRQEYESGKLPPNGDPAWTNPATASRYYSIVLWQMVKHWELQQEFALDGMSRAVFGSQADDRAWTTNIPFQASPSIRKIPPGSPGVGNGKTETFTYTSFAWYYTQMILNHSNKRQLCTVPVDWGYLYGFFGGMSRLSGPQGMLLLGVLTKGLQISNNGYGPEKGCIFGWMFEVNDPSRLVGVSNYKIWDGMPRSTSAALINAYVGGWWNVFSKFTPQQFYTGGTTSATEQVVAGYGEGNMASRFAFMIPHLRFAGLSPTLANAITDWAAKAWPTYDWNRVRNSTCFILENGMVRCTSDQ